jgi:hypothetical protein
MLTRNLLPSSFCSISLLSPTTKAFPFHANDVHFLVKCAAFEERWLWAISPKDKGKPGRKMGGLVSCRSKG